MRAAKGWNLRARWVSGACENTLLPVVEVHLQSSQATLRSKNSRFHPTSILDSYAQDLQDEQSQIIGAFDNDCGTPIYMGCRGVALLINTLSR